jgi:hypothetical protein
MHLQATLHEQAGRALFQECVLNNTRITFLTRKWELQEKKNKKVKREPNMPRYFNTPDTMPTQAVVEHVTSPSRQSGTDTSRRPLTGTGRDTSRRFLRYRLTGVRHTTSFPPTRVHYPLCGYPSGSFYLH